MGLTTSLVRTPKKSREEILATPPKKIFVIRQHNQMGDMLLAVPAFRAIKETFPDAEVTVLSAPINRDVLKNNPYVDHVMTFDKLSPFGTLGLVGKARQQRFDLVIVLHTVSFSFTSGLLGLLSGACHRIGSTSAPWGHRLSTAFFHFELPLPSQQELATMNESEHNLYPLRAFGIDTDDIGPLLVPDVDNVAFAERFLRQRTRKNATVIAVHPGAGKVGNIWSTTRFGATVKLLAQSCDLDVVVIQGPRDAETVATFIADTRAGEVLKQRPIGDVAAVLQRVDLVLCNDTGVMHVAAAAGANTLAVFGPTDPFRWAPRRDNLHIVRSDDGSLEGITADMVAQRALALLPNEAIKPNERAADD